MPIPQLERKSHASEHAVREASAVRRRRIALRRGNKPPPHTSSQPQHTSKTPRRKKSKLQFFLRTCIITFVIFLISIPIALFAAYTWVASDLADISDVDRRAISESTKIFARDETTLLYETGDTQHTEVKFSDINDYVKWATIVLEDREFYQHSGFKITSIIRAALSNTFSGQTQGASTLTQQFIKNAILSSEQTYTRKIKELILAVRLEQKYSKNEILERYLNEVPYGATYQGVETGAQRYFGKSAKDVSLAEAATLASLPKSPVKLPRDPERLKARRDYALDEMANLGYITKDQAETAKQEPLNLNTEHITAITAAHFVFYVQSILEDKYGQNTVRKGGLKVITTLDIKKQRIAEDGITEGMTKVEQYGGSNAALVSLDAHTGQILAMVGSRNFFDDDHDGQVNVALTLQQPGSSIKPVTYLTAFMKGYTPDTKLYDVETDFPSVTGIYHPHNYTLTTSGPLPLRQTLTRSLNIPAVKLLYLVGLDNALNTAEQLGYTTFRDRDNYGLSFTLGGADVTLLEHVAAYATYAREGEYHKPAAILRVENQKGKKMEEWKDAPRRAIDEKSVRILNDVLSDSQARSGIFAYVLNLSGGREVAAKTGTTNDFTDAWTMGFTPSIAAGVWVGNNNNAQMKNGADGSIVATPIWKYYMEHVLADTPKETFKEAEYRAENTVLSGQLDETVTISVDRVTEKRIPDECLATYPKNYIATKEVKRAHEILHYIVKENPTGPAQEHPENDPMYKIWEAGAQEWVNKNKPGEYLTDAFPTTPCNLRDENQQPSLTLVPYENPESVTRKSFFIAANAKPGKDRTITTAEYIIDDIRVETQTDLSLKRPQEIRTSYRPKNLTSGRHAITVRVTDDSGNSTEVTTKIIYSAE